LPHPDYFPFSSIGGNIVRSGVFSPPAARNSTVSWLWDLFSGEKSSVKVPKYSGDPPGLELAKLLQYTPATGNPVLNEIIQNLTKKVYQPGYSNYTTLLHDGNTDAWAKAILTLCNPGDAVLMEEWTYPSAVATMRPYNINPVPIELDSQGICPDSLRNILSKWDDDIQGAPRYVITLI
jgi:aromatic amino acid aminotransferase I / 2-aminoadipate transaminase